MTTPPRPELISLEQWRALGEDTSVRSELKEGVLIMSPSPWPRHQVAVMLMGAQLVGQAPADLVVVPEVDVTVDPSFPPTVRRPDLIVRRRDSSAEITPDQVLVVVELLSPGTRRTDLVTKRSEYADAGVPHYWIVDLDGGPSMEALVLGNGAYGGSTVTGTFETTVPFGLRIDLAALA